MSEGTEEPAALEGVDPADVRTFVGMLGISEEIADRCSELFLFVEDDLRRRHAQRRHHRAPRRGPPDERRDLPRVAGAEPRPPP